MKIVIVKPPKLFAPMLKYFFKIRKMKQNSEK